MAWFFGARVDLTPEEQEFTFTFDATEASYANTRISFDLGNIDGAEDGNTTGLFVRCQLD